MKCPKLFSPRLNINETRSCKPATTATGRCVFPVLVVSCAVALTGCQPPRATGEQPQSSDKAAVTMDLGGGNKADLGSIPTDIGVDIYPGASPAAAPGSTINGPEGSIKLASYTTKDSIDQVFEFYKSKLEVTAPVHRGSGEDHKMATLFRAAGKSRLTVTITRQDSSDVTALDIKNVTEN